VSWRDGCCTTRNLKASRGDSGILGRTGSCRELVRVLFPLFQQQRVHRFRRVSEIRRPQPAEGLAWSEQTASRGEIEQTHGSCNRKPFGTRNGYPCTVVHQNRVSPQLRRVQARPFRRHRAAESMHRRGPKPHASSQLGRFFAPALTDAGASMCLNSSRTIAGTKTLSKSAGRCCRAQLIRGSAAARHQRRRADPASGNRGGLSPAARAQDRRWCRPH